MIINSSKGVFTGLLVLISFFSYGQEINSYFEMVRPEFNGNKALETTAYVEQFWRLAGNTGFDKSIARIVEELKEAGFKEEGTAATRLTYRIEKRKMDEPSWEPVGASLSISGISNPLLEFKTNRNMLAINSFSTPGNGVEAEVIALQNGQLPAGVSGKGKILYGEMNPYRAYQVAVKNEAIGILTYNNPDYVQPAVNTNSIQFRNIPYKEENKLWSICLSFAANKSLKEQLARGKVTAKVKVETRFIEADELTVVAEVKGSKSPEERFVLSAHVQEPGANDNASGVGTLVEMARVTAKLVSENSLDPKRTITFLWGDEIVSTNNFVNDDKERKKNIKWGMSLDMVGENTSITGGSFLIEKMPDPSAIWTRGDDKHTEWGAGDVKEADLFPHYLNDLVLTIFRKQGEFANWQVNYNPFEGGSDHVPFIRGGIPGVLLWHFTDQFYHTDLDRIDKVSAKEMKNVGIGALVIVYLLSNSDSQTANWIAMMASQAGKARIDKEFELSKKAIELNGNAEEQIGILQAWIDYYIKTIGSVKDIDEDNEELMQVINNEISRFKQYSTSLIQQLK